MEGNLFASIIASNEQICRQMNEISSCIPDNAASDWTTSNIALSSESPYTMSIDGIKEEQESFMLIPKTYVMYVFKFIRHSDGEIHTVAKRFRDLNAWFQEMINEGRIRHCDGLEFPSKKIGQPENWIVGERTNPSGTYVRSRITELERFFGKLFARNPGLYEDPKVIMFFQLTSFSFDVKKVSARSYYGSDDIGAIGGDDYTSTFKSHFLDHSAEQKQIGKKDVWEV